MSKIKEKQPSIKLFLSFVEAVEEKNEGEKGTCSKKVLYRNEIALFEADVVHMSTVTVGSFVNAKKLLQPRKNHPQVMQSLLRRFCVFLWGF